MFVKVCGLLITGLVVGMYLQPIVSPVVLNLVVLGMGLVSTLVCYQELNKE